MRRCTCFRPRRVDDLKRRSCPSPPPADGRSERSTGNRKAAIALHSREGRPRPARMLKRSPPCITVLALRVDVGRAGIERQPVCRGGHCFGSWALAQAHTAFEPPAFPPAWPALPACDCAPCSRAAVPVHAPGRPRKRGASPAADRHTPRGRPAQLQRNIRATSAPHQRTMSTGTGLAASTVRPTEPSTVRRSRPPSLAPSTTRS